MSRTPAAVIIGFLFMLVAPFIFTEWEVHALMNVSLVSIVGQMGTAPVNAFATWFELGFRPEASIFRIFSENWLFDFVTPQLVNDREIIWMVIMAWFSTAFVIGLIAKGAKRSTFASLGVFIVYFALHLIFAILIGIDLARMFTDELMDTLGVLLTGVLCSVLGGVIGGSVGGAGGE